MSRAVLAALAVVAAALVAAPPAPANRTSSSNWAGYAVHRRGVRFTSISARWRQPSAACANGQATSAAIWLGLGGYKRSTRALEQIGTEVDCTSSGAIKSSAWFELIPADSRTVAWSPRVGDLMSARVSVRGRRVTVSLADQTMHRSFRRVIHPSELDTSSAEWIVEAPQACNSSNSCHTLALANFGSTSFIRASARSSRGHTGSIADGRWRRTRINLVAHGRQYAASGAGAASGIEAVVSALGGRGSSFVVAYRQIAV